VLTKLRGGTTELRVETGRWIGLKGRRGFASSVEVHGEVEHEVHSVLHCEALSEERRNLVSMKQ